MSYNRYQRLRKYVNGRPAVPAEYKRGELLEIGAGDTQEQCEQMGTPTSMFVCEGGKAYRLYEKYQDVYVKGAEWEFYSDVCASGFRGDLTDSEYCQSDSDFKGYIPEESYCEYYSSTWRKVTGTTNTYACQGTLIKDDLQGYVSKNFGNVSNVCSGGSFSSKGLNMVFSLAVVHPRNSSGTQYDKWVVTNFSGIENGIIYISPTCLKKLYEIQDDLYSNNIWNILLKLNVPRLDASEVHSFNGSDGLRNTDWSNMEEFLLPKIELTDTQMSNPDFNKRFFNENMTNLKIVKLTRSCYEHITNVSSNYWGLGEVLFNSIHFVIYD